MFFFLLRFVYWQQKKIQSLEKCSEKSGNEDHTEGRSGSGNNAK